MNGSEVLKTGCWVRKGRAMWALEEYSTTMYSKLEIYGNYRLLMNAQDRYYTNKSWSGINRQISQTSPKHDHPWL